MMALRTFPETTPRSDEWAWVFAQRRGVFVVEEADDEDQWHDCEPVRPEELDGMDDAGVGDLDFGVEDGHVEMAWMGAVG